MRNVELKELLLELNRKQKWLARTSGVKLWKLNMHLNHFYPLTRKERVAITRVLNRVLPPWGTVDEATLFLGTKDPS